MNRGLQIYLGLLLFLAFFGPYVSPYSPMLMSVGAELSAPSLQHWMGTDQFGRDIFSRVIFGTRNALLVAFSSSLLALVFGGSLAALGVLWGGVWDRLSRRVADILFSLPELLLALMFMVALGVSTSNLIIALGLVYTPVLIRVSRSSFLQTREEDYIKSAQAIGCTNQRLFFRHLLPNSLTPILTQFHLCMSLALLAESALSFIGFGVEPGSPTWGLMLSESKNWISEAPWISIFPGLAISITALSFNLVRWRWKPQEKSRTASY